jgi:hypothetical protein
MTLLDNSAFGAASHRDIKKPDNPPQWIIGVLLTFPPPGIS